ncbi:hypothetical protein GCM10028796_44410 [Ramlibacter monticola]|uniref:Uncharacterized protein n=1 Tax=Ramlibacter monticola TaxID=1926872 RepID=A0A936Z3P3_9BURK|nr:hypothetical protein [Ramlibacter monticola]MBL0393040.1 hypothetical protein [Ramlibacter monticola]
MTSTSTRRVVVAAAALACSIGGATALAQNQAAGGNLARPHALYAANAVVEGRSMAEWSAEWWQYVMASPQSANPLADATGAACSFMQHGPVWFLMGTVGSGSVTRACTLPEGKALLLPLINFLDYNVASQAAAELRAEAVGCMDAVSQLRLEIDGVPVAARVLNTLRVKSVVFDITVPSNDSNVPAATVYSPAISDGYFALVAPLVPGQHTLRFGGASAGCYYAPTNFQVLPWEVDVTYRLTVKPVALR